MEAKMGGRGLDENVVGDIERSIQRKEIVWMAGDKRHMKE